MFTIRNKEELLVVLEDSYNKGLVRFEDILGEPCCFVLEEGY